MTTEIDTGVEAMGRPKRGAKREEKPADERVAIVHLKGTQEYFEWLEAVHAKTHIPKATIIRLALKDWAKANGHPVPPEL